MLANDSIEPLPTDRLDIWYFLVRSEQPDVLARCRRLLSVDELEQANRFIFDADRALYTLAHGLLRTVLSRYTGFAPQSWQFERGQHGRPEIASPRLPRRLRFNLTHTRGMAAVAVAWERDIGVDAENITRHDVGPQVAEHYFAPAEVASLRRLTKASRTEEFFRYWTLKESYIKARGLGLSLALEKFWFVLHGESVRFETAWDLDDDPADWQFDTRMVGDRFRLSSAIRRERSADLEILVRRAEELADT